MKPLERIKVIEFTMLMAVPAISRILGEWSAELIKAEPPAGDPLWVNEASI